MKYLAIYYGYQEWSRRNIERGIVFSTIEELEAWMTTTTTYCNKGYPHLELNPASREKVQNWMNEPGKPAILKTPGCGAWSLLFTLTECNSFEEYKQQRDEELKAKKEEREQKRLEKLFEQKKGWYRVTLQLSGDGVTTGRYACKEFTGDVIATSGADAYDKAVKDCEINAPGFYPADMMGAGYCFEFLGAMTNEGYSVELWEDWKKNQII